ncbi:hypothetical protein Adt_22145 [Abeliophyllum distichum]|uniref:Uncharacterized protein n=1 Tax=Abeliophyllum distichum TaxID=126358 RepID=A0ABD1T1D1_9LAMI
MCLGLGDVWGPQVEAEGTTMGWVAVVDGEISTRVRKIPTKANDKRSPFVYETEGPKATGSCSDVAIISEYCKGNSLAVEYLLGLKLIGLHIEDVSFPTDQMEGHLEVGNTRYGNYDSSAKRRLLVSLGIFLRIYYKGGMLGEQSVSLPRASVLTEGQPAS